MFLVRFLSILIFSSLLVACSTTRDGVRSSPGEQGTITVEVPYATALHNLKKGLSTCVDANNKPMTTYVYGVGAMETHRPLAYLVEETISSGISSRIDYVEETVFFRKVSLSLDVMAKGYQSEITYYGRHSIIPLSALRSRLADMANGKGGCE